MDAFLHNLVGHMPYLGVVGVLLLSGIGLPIPEDIPLIVGGYLCFLEVADLWLMVPMALAAVLCGDSILFFLGRRYGHHVPRLPVLRHYLSEARLQRAEAAYHKHGGKTLFLMRFVPGVRSAAFFTAGAFKIPYWKLLAFDGSAALISVPTLVLVGYYGGGHIDQVKTWSRDGQLLLVLAIATVVTAVWLYKRWRKGRGQGRIAAPPLTPPTLNAWRGSKSGVRSQK